MSIDVLVADDSAVVRRAIRRLLSDQPGINLVGEAADYAQTIRMMIDLQPRVVVLDLHMPDGNTITSQDFRIQIDHVAARLLAISVWDDEETRALAESFGAVKLLDKVNLGTHLVPAILQFAPAAAEST